jgi:hypothetical protein
MATQKSSCQKKKCEVFFLSLYLVQIQRKLVRFPLSGVKEKKGKNIQQRVFASGHPPNY